MRNFCTVAIFTVAFFMQRPTTATDFHVYYLGGQSNMDGYGYVKDIPTQLAETVSNVHIFHGNTSPDNAATDGRGVWSNLRPGHGVGFSSDGISNKYSERFGVELTFAAALQKRFPNRKFALIKYSRGGTSIAQDAAGSFGCWEPDFVGSNGINQYDHFLATVRNAFADRDIDNDGNPDRLIPAGIVWMQGESDAQHTEETATQYEANLKRLMDLIRAALRTDDLPVAIGEISDSPKDPNIWKFGDAVRAAQASWVTNDSNAALVTTTQNYQYSDPWHYDSAGYIDLGEEFARQLPDIEVRDEK